MKKTLAQIISKLFIAYYKLRYGSRVNFGKNVIVTHKFKIKGTGQLVIEDDCNLWTNEEPNQFHFYHPKAQITIGKKTRLNGATFHAEEKIEIGNNCRLGSAILMDTDFHTFEDPKHILHGNKKTKPIHIGNHVWIGGQSVLLKGCNLGDGSVVGFRAVVTKSFPKHVVVAGNPAKIVKS